MGILVQIRGILESDAPFAEGVDTRFDICDGPAREGIWRWREFSDLSDAHGDPVAPSASGSPARNCGFDPCSFELRARAASAAAVKAVRVDVVSLMPPRLHELLAVA